MGQGSRNKIDFPHTPKRDSKIPVPQVKPHISFSLKYWENTEDFNYNDKDKHYFMSLIDRIKCLCGISVTEFRTTRNASIRIHPIKWEETSRRGFGMRNPELNDSDAWQFSVSRNAHGRVHGFFIADVFYIRWFDPDHNLFR